MSHEAVLKRYQPRARVVEGRRATDGASIAERGERTQTWLILAEQ